MANNDRDPSITFVSKAGEGRRLCTILRCPFLAPIHTNFEGEARALKPNFSVKIFQKVPKNAFLSCFFSKFCLRREKFGYNKVFLLLRENLENEFIQKKV